MRRVLLICVCSILAGMPAAWGQAANHQAKQGILGFLDPQTGAFRAIPAALEDTDAQAGTIFSGTVTVTFTITATTTALTNFTCSVQVSVTDGTTSPTFISEEGTVSGISKTCKVTIPYSWSLTSQATDRMTTSYFVSGSGGTTTTTQRTSTRNPLDVRAVPLSGTTTTLTAAVRL